MRRRAAVLAAILVAAAALLGAGTWAVVYFTADPGPECSVASAERRADTADLTLTAVQLQHASTINAVGLARGEPERARVIAIATAMQESSLRNIDYGDRDSLGLFQQRPSQGWGDEAEILDPVYSAGAFYDALSAVPSWQQMSLTEAAQAVQRSAFPDAYATWESDARILVGGLSGAAADLVTCRAGAVASTATQPERPGLAGASGADPRLAGLLAAAGAEFGDIAVAPLGAAATEAEVSITLPGLAPRVAGRALAAWLVAHATTFPVSTVAVDSAIWQDHSWAESSDTRPAGAVHVVIAG